MYRLNLDGLAWESPGAHPVDANLGLGEVLLANAPAAGAVCAPGAELGTIEGLTTRPVFGGPDHLSALGARLHGAAEALFTPVEGSRSSSPTTNASSATTSPRPSAESRNSSRTMAGPLSYRGFALLHMRHAAAVPLMPTSLPAAHPIDHRS